MKNILKMVLVSGLMAFAMSGCISEKAYNTGKVIYKGAKTVYIELPVENEKLELMDSVVVTYDKVRTTVKDEIALQKNKKKESVSSLEVQQK